MTDVISFPLEITSVGMKCPQALRETQFAVTI